MLRRWLKALGEGETKAMLATSLLILVVLSSPFAVVYGQKWLNIYRFDAGGESSRGTPPFRSATEHHTTARGQTFSHTELKTTYKIVALDFPDARSCLQKDIGEISTNSLKLMDWEKLDSPTEAMVCTFRLLATGGNADYAVEWMRDQGLTRPDGSPVTPWNDGSGNLIVSGSWNIREKGYKHITGGIVLHLLGPPYAMSVYSSWSEDGQRLQYVSVSFKIK
jgi:hypothetical protein